MRTGTNVDWGVTLIESIDLKNIKSNAFLYRNDSLIAQSDQASFETGTIFLKSKNAIKNIFIKINDFPYGQFKDFNLKIWGSNISNGNFVELYNGKNKNLFQMAANNLTSYIKLEIESTEGKIIKDIDVFVQYKEGDESPNVSDINNGYCVSKLYDIGTECRSILKDVEYELISGDNIKIQVRGLKTTNNESTWTSWYDLDKKHEFNQYRYFQFKVIIIDSLTKARINKFIFEVKG